MAYNLLSGECLLVVDFERKFATICVRFFKGSVTFIVLPISYLGSFVYQ